MSNVFASPTLRKAVVQLHETSKHIVFGNVIDNGRLPRGRMNSYRTVCPPRKAGDITVRILRKEGSP